MSVTLQVHEIVAHSATVKVSDGGRFGVIAFASSAPGAAHYRMTMSRQLLDRLAVQIVREQKRVQKPARRRQSAREST
jgi:hypothetical protein